MFIFASPDISLQHFRDQAVVQAVGTHRGADRDAPTSGRRRFVPAFQWEPWLPPSWASPPHQISGGSCPGKGWKSGTLNKARMPSGILEDGNGKSSQNGCLKGNIIYKTGFSLCLPEGIKNKSCCCMGRRKARPAIPPLASYDLPDLSRFHSRMIFPTRLIRNTVKSAY